MKKNLTKNTKSARIIHKSRQKKPRTTKHLFSRILIAIIIVCLLVGFAIYETFSILEKEHSRQYEIFTDQKSQIDFNLNMIKIAVMTKDSDSYHENLSSAKEHLQTIKTLSFIVDEESNYITKSTERLAFLAEKESAVSEMKTLSEKISVLAETLTSSYSDQSSLTRDTLKQISPNLENLKINPDNYHDETVLAIVNSVNEILNSIISSNNELSNCIDTCYENKFTSINNSLSEKIKPLVENFPTQNSAFEKQFQFNDNDF